VKKFGSSSEESTYSSSRSSNRLSFSDAVPAA
jgi:hypothetical protein